MADAESRSVARDDVGEMEQIANEPSPADLPQCESCRQISNRVLIGEDWRDANRRHEWLTSVEREAWYGPTLEQLRERRSSCALCREVFLLLANFNLLGGDQARRTVLRFVTSQGYLSNGRREKFNLILSRIVMNEGVAALSVDVETSPRSGDFGNVAKVGLRIFAPQNASKDISGPVKRREVSSLVDERTFDWAREQFHKCSEQINNHSACAVTLSKELIDETRQDASRLPTRVVAINEDSWSVKITDRQRGKYVALSYCWGGVEAAIQLTRGNIADLQHEQSMDLLPQTLQDAMVVTRRLGFQHIWIDQLCIMQGDAEDWAQEAGQMAAVYGEATLTIVTMAAENAGSGCLGRQDFGKVAIPWYNEDASADPAKGGSTIGYVWATASLAVEWPTPESTARSGLEAEKMASRWHTRGWTFQERILARRVLYLGKYQWYWECQEWLLSEDCFDDSTLKAESKRSLASNLGMNDDFLDTLRNSAEMEIKRTTRQADGQPGKFGLAVLKGAKSVASNRLVKSTTDAIGSAAAKTLHNNDRYKILQLAPYIYDFTGRQISQSTDKLVAFEGFASVIAKRTRMPLYAGIWTMDLARNLFWFANDGPFQKPDCVRAPSWSWAAWDGEIRNAEALSDWNFFSRRKTHGNGDLENPSFLPENFRMQSIKPIEPISLVVSGCIGNGISPSWKLTVDVAKTFQELKQVIDLWSSPDAPWVGKNAQLLFMEADRQNGSVDPHFEHKCRICNRDLRAESEANSILHIEHCESGKSLDGSNGGQLEQAKLCGVAYFDEPDNAPIQMKTLLLFHQTTPKMTFRNPALEKGKWRSVPTSKQPDVNDLVKRTFLTNSKHSALGLKAQDEKDQAMMKSLWNLRGNYEDGKRTYFLLLLQETERKDHFRRVGVAIAYWIPNLPRFGGLALHKTDLKAAEDARPSRDGAGTNPSRIILV